MKISRAKKIVITLSLLYLAALIIFYSTNLIDEEKRNLAQNITYLVAPVFTVLGGIYALKHHDLKTIQGKALLYLAIGFFLWLIAEISFTILDSILHADVYPSIADFFFVTADIFLVTGVFFFLKIGKINWTKTRALVSILTISVLAYITYILTIEGFYDSDAVLLENTITAAYGITDLILVTLSIMMINLSLEFKGGKYSKSWLVFGIGVALYWLGDVIVYGLFIEQYEAQDPLFRQFDYLWIAAHILIGAALFMQGKAMKSFNEGLQKRLKT